MTAPASVLTLTLDGHLLSATRGQTILQVAHEHGVRIPALCHMEGVSSVGACRLCVVQVAGQARLLAACTTQVREGMEIVTHSEKLDAYRRQILELNFAEGNHICSVCVSNGHCELQDLAVELGVSSVRYPYLFQNVVLDASHERFVADHNRCILCTRCVRVCDEIEGAHTWDVMGRGITAQIVTDLMQPWGESLSCTSCGKCVQVCPTGALFVKGRASGEMIHRRDFLPYLTRMRETHL